MDTYNIYNSIIDKRVSELKKLTETFKGSDDVEPVTETLGNLLFAVNAVLDNLRQPGLTTWASKPRIKQLAYSLGQLALEIHDFEQF